LCRPPKRSAIAAAFARVPRHLFVPDVSLEEAYRDTFIATKRQPDGEVISSSSQPEIMAIMRGRGPREGEVHKTPDAGTSEVRKGLDGDRGFLERPGGSSGGKSPNDGRLL
jgi:hypothetical protein